MKPSIIKKPDLKKAVQQSRVMHVSCLFAYTDAGEFRARVRVYLTLAEIRQGQEPFVGTQRGEVRVFKTADALVSFLDSVGARRSIWEGPYQWREMEPAEAVIR